VFPGNLSHAPRTDKITYFRKVSVPLDGFTAPALEQVLPKQPAELRELLEAQPRKNAK